VIASPAHKLSAFGSVHSFLHSTAFRLAVELSGLFVCVFWLGLAFWTFRDARRRIGDQWLVGTATLLGLVPFIGPLVYLLFRPPETLEEIHAREVEVRALEARLARRQLRCPICRSEIESDYLVCPVCTTQLKRACGRCHAPLEPLWQACPYCAAPVGARIEAVPADLDAALTAEATAVAQGKPGRTPSKRARAS
jgi:hypothetical protein